eukprot:CAMPEP_0174361006 /NCGR_PEP_ID=MMETSP0811_2-20130205/57250_1 /TAXON_ID=73025 ORGANISM="Eutreptiella gymnastica-like, Strain CCMP1594" /NCGR_SAMPLE_ID=MMETSP0811_2 /ASSEMBLY_ACC=CAM_ASM_000667 /LENGTH=130 /DNA_ID=CAMNT_0015497309 /DNA_START=439 /DNA_END=829 /DNA_ORIENTATION=-
MASGGSGQGKQTKPPATILGNKDESCATIVPQKSTLVVDSAHGADELNAIITKRRGDNCHVRRHSRVLMGHEKNCNLREQRHTNAASPLHKVSPPARHCLGKAHVPWKAGLTCAHGVVVAVVSIWAVQSP